MASFYPCVKNHASGYTFYISLVSQADTKIAKVSPTLAAGDFKIAIDDGAPNNLNTLPVLDADFTKRVKVVLSQAECNGDNLTIICNDVTGAEWCDLTINIQTVPRRFDDLAYPATSGRSMVVDANGLVDANVVKLGPTGSGTAQTARDVGLALPAAAPGADGGLLKLGANTAATGMSITATTGDALYLVSSAGNGSGLKLLGNGSGPGLLATGGATVGAAGIKAIGGSSGGPGLWATASAASNYPGIKTDGYGSGAGLAATGGTSGDGVFAQGGATSGHGVNASSPWSGHGIWASAQGDGHGVLVEAAGNYSGLKASGDGTGHGVEAVSGSGATGDGFRATAISVNGHGAYFGGVGTGHGVCSVAGATGHGINAAATSGSGVRAVGGTNGHGVEAVGAGSGSGLRTTAGATGHGLHSVGGAVSGDGMRTEAATSGDGIRATGAGGGYDINADIEGSVKSIANGGIVAASFAANAIDANALAQDAAQEIADVAFARALTAESYAADGAVPTLSQSLYMLLSALTQYDISGTALTTRKLDGTTQAMVYTLDDASDPTSRVRTT